MFVGFDVSPGPGTVAAVIALSRGPCGACCSLVHKGTRVSTRGGLEKTFVISIDLGICVNDRATWFTV